MGTPRIRTVADGSHTVLSSDFQILGNFDTRDQAVAHVCALGHDHYVNEDFDTETEFKIN